MAQKYIVQLIDDLTSEPIEEGAGETVTFAVDGVSYAIDLSTANADTFRAAVQRYVAAARTAESSPTKARTANRPTAKSDLKDVRDWASTNGFTVSTRGRIPANVQEAYAAAH